MTKPAKRPVVPIPKPKCGGIPGDDFKESPPWIERNTTYFKSKTNRDLLKPRLISLFDPIRPAIEKPSRKRKKIRIRRKCQVSRRRCSKIYLQPFRHNHMPLFQV